MLHLIEQGNVKLGKLITLIALTITLRYKDINFSSTNSTRHIEILPDIKFTISFSLNEHDFPPLSNVCQPILSIVSESRLHQRKPANNVKLHLLVSI